LGRRGYTSKLRRFEELAIVGGVSLGFRGEALASAAELGEVTVTTRVQGEIVAIATQIKASGGIDSQTRVSHPIGATVNVTNFLAGLPVRKQLALKESKKTIARIKVLLQSFALARPKVRLNFRIPKAPRDNWSFSPNTRSCGASHWRRDSCLVYGKD